VSSVAIVGKLAAMALLSEEDVERELASHEGWSREGEAITREWKLEDFPAALRFVVRVGEAAEAAGHHPDILLHGWNKVKLTLSTHSQGGLTAADFQLAGQIDGLA
jgi:4a-hydroxytetrahydrobiopterin dehydratase